MEMRLNKYIAACGIASRRKADRLIANGNVKVNGAVVREKGYSTAKGDIIRINGRRIVPVTHHTYIMLNKPKGYITTVTDDRDRKTVSDLVSDVQARLFPVGRLDRDTTGLLIMTDDGDLAYKITHPGYEITKTYRALITGTISKEKIWALRNGVDIGGFVTSKAKVDIIRQNKKNTLIEISIHEGKNRQIRRMLKAVGKSVIQLERVAIGKVYLGKLMQGHYRKLRQNEIDYLKESD